MTVSIRGAVSILKIQEGSVRNSRKPHKKPMGCKVDQGIWFSDEDWKQRWGTQAQWGWDGELKGLVRLGCSST